jgi:hypothetical protein
VREESSGLDSNSADGDTVESIGTYEVASMLDRDKNVGDLEYLCSLSESFKVNHVEEEIPLGVPGTDNTIDVNSSGGLHDGWLETNISESSMCEVSTVENGGATTGSVENNSITLADDITEDDIEIFKQNEIAENAAMSLSQDGQRSEYVPQVGMSFSTDDEAHKFYNNYAMIIGFSTIKSGTYMSRNKNTMGEITRRIYKCNRSGTIEHRYANTDAQWCAVVAGFGANGKMKGLQMTVVADEGEPVPAAKKRRTKVIDKTNYLAEMTITRKNCMWVVTRLVLEHNHNLLPPSKAKLLRSHRYFSEQEKAMMRSLIPQR